MRPNTKGDFHKKYVKRENGCWEWTGARNKKGYGRFVIHGILDLAHRWSYSFKYIPPRQFHVLHKCDNPPCVNPDHLFIGDNFINQQDRVAKGRHYQKNKTHCKNGHEFTKQTTRLYKGSRYCRVCNRHGVELLPNYHSTKTHCPKGHAYTEENTYKHAGKRSCRKCSREKTRAWEAKQELVIDNSIKADKAISSGEKCVHGHLYTRENIYIRKSGRYSCRICIKAGWIKSRKKRRTNGTENK